MEKALFQDGLMEKLDHFYLKVENYIGLLKMHIQILKILLVE